MNLRKSASAATMIVAALALAGCSSMGSTQNVQTSSVAPEQLTPVQNSSVSTGSLPPLAGAATTQQIAPGLSGTPVLGGVQTAAPGTPGAPGSTAVAANTTVNADGSFVSMNDVGTTSLGRNLTGALTVDRLFGGWNIAGGGTQCRLNLAQAQAEGGRYRASAPACPIQGLTTVSSWALVGNGIQLYDATGSLLAVLQLSGDRFIGTVSGGVAVTMSA